jgi:hypothetical protein
VNLWMGSSIMLFHGLLFLHHTSSGVVSRPPPAPGGFRDKKKIAKPQSMQNTHEVRFFLRSFIHRGCRRRGSLKHSTALNCTTFTTQMPLARAFPRSVGHSVCGCGVV